MEHLLIFDILAILLYLSILFIFASLYKWYKARNQLPFVTDLDSLKSCFTTYVEIYTLNMNVGKYSLALFLTRQMQKIVKRTFLLDNLSRDDGVRMLFALIVHEKYSLSNQMLKASGYDLFEEDGDEGYGCIPKNSFLKELFCDLYKHLRYINDIDCDKYSILQVSRLLTKIRGFIFELLSRNVISKKKASILYCYLESYEAYVIFYLKYGNYPYKRDDIDY